MSRKVIDNPDDCSLIHSMNLIGGKWKIIIIYLLANKSLRFGKISMFLPTISSKVLTQQLRELEEDGLIIREKFAEIPPRVEYSLSNMGEGLLPALRLLSEWTVKSFEEIEFEKCHITL